MNGIKFFIQKIKEKGLKIILKYFFLSPLLEGLFKILPYSPLRILFLNILGAKIKYNSMIYGINLINYDIGSLKNLKIGNDVYIEPGVFIDVFYSIEIKDHARIAPGCIILTHSKAGNVLDKVFPPRKIPIKIGKNSWIGSNAVIMANIGDGVVIAPGSLVNKDIPANCVAVGVPAKIIRKMD
jgi:acetyltransferase-like isoleucine patch superfamily enzyme